MKKPQVEEGVRTVQIIWTTTGLLVNLHLGEREKCLAIWILISLLSLLIYLLYDSVWSWKLLVLDLQICGNHLLCVRFYRIILVNLNSLSLLVFCAHTELSLLKEKNVSVIELTFFISFQAWILACQGHSIGSHRWTWLQTLPLSSLPRPPVTPTPMVARHLPGENFCFLFRFSYLFFNHVFYLGAGTGFNTGVTHVHTQATWKICGVNFFFSFVFCCWYCVLMIVFIATDIFTSPKLFENGQQIGHTIFQGKLIGVLMETTKAFWLCLWKHMTEHCNLQKYWIKLYLIHYHLLLGHYSYIPEHVGKLLFWPDTKEIHSRKLQKCPPC